MGGVSRARSSPIDHHALAMERPPPPPYSIAAHPHYGRRLIPQDARPKVSSPELQHAIVISVFFLSILLYFMINVREPPGTSSRKQYICKKLPTFPNGH